VCDQVVELLGEYEPRADDQGPHADGAAGAAETGAESRNFVGVGVDWKRAIEFVGPADAAMVGVGIGAAILHDGGPAAQLLLHRR